MDSGGEDDGFSDGDFFRLACEIGDYEHVYIVARKTLAEHCFSYFIFIIECTCLSFKSQKICVSVRVTVGEVNCVHVMFRCKLERQAVVHCPVTIVRRLLCGRVGVGYLVRTEVLSASKLWWILVFIRFFNSSCLIICNVLAVSLPAHVRQVCFFKWVNQRSHTLLVCRVWLHEVN